MVPGRSEGRGGEGTPRGRSKAQPSRKSAAGWIGKPPLFPTRMPTIGKGVGPDGRPSLETYESRGGSTALPQERIKERDRPSPTKPANIYCSHANSKHRIRCHLCSVMFLPKGNAQRMSEQEFQAQTD